MSGLGQWLVLSPGSLAAGLVALIIPLVIHLISRSRGRRILVGSTRLIREARRKRIYELRLTQWILFINRSLMLLIAALILGRLATPGLETLNGDAAYVTPGWLGAATPEQHERLEQGIATVRVLAPGFPSIKDFEQSTAHETGDLWPLLAERLSVVSHNGTIHVYSSGTNGEFGDLAPVLPSAVNWHFAEPRGPAAVNLPLRVAIIGQEMSGEVTHATLQALQIIKNHRLPELQWTVVEADLNQELLHYEIVIQTTAQEPRTVPAMPSRRHQWIDLSHSEWGQAWSSADFPQRLLDAMLDERATRQIWASARLPVAAAPARVLESRGSIQLPRRSAQFWLTVALILLWGLERWLSERKSRAPV